jgi:uncharacterized protein
MELVKDAVSWFEIPVSDFERAKTFYQKIFDFEMPEMDMGNIRMGILLYNREEHGVGGAICLGEGYTPSSTGTKVYLNGGADLNTVLGRIAGAGGNVVLPKTEIAPDMGHFAFFHDTEGNMVGLYSAG